MANHHGDDSIFRGATGQHPMGKLTEHDEGELQFTIGQKDGKVVLDFGKPVAWVGMPAQQAADLAAFLIKRARAVARENGESISVTIL